MDQHKIVEELFSSSSHFQLIKKSTKLIIFLAQHKSLKEREVDILWSAITVNISDYLNNINNNN